MTTLRLAAIFCIGTTGALAAPADTFESIDGGQISLNDWAGQPILLVNTASMCGFTDQYGGLQDLYDTYRDQGLVVLAVPSDDFAQELDSNEEVKDYCEMVFGLDIPMTTITPVLGAGAHPVYQWLEAEAEFAPSWNFNKVLLDGEGEVVETYGALIEPTSGRIISDIETLLREP